MKRTFHLHHNVKIKALTGAVGEPGITILTSSYGNTISSVWNIFIEEVAVILDVVSEEVGGCPHHQTVSVDGVVQTARRQAEDLLVDVEDVEVMVGLVGNHPARHVAHPLVRIVNENL